MTYPTLGGQRWPAGSGSLAALTDVDTSGVADGDALTYNSATGKWEPVAPTGTAGERPVGCTFDNGGLALTTTGQTKLRVPVAAAGDVVRVQVDTQGGSGSATLGVKRGTTGGALSDVTGGNDIVLSGATNLVDTTLAGWSPTHSAHDVYEFELKGVSTFTQVTLVLFYA